MGKGKLIVIEGLDGVGKTTQVKLLEEILIEQGHDVWNIHYPAYDYVSSTFATKFLKGELGKMEEIPLGERMLYYALDRVMHQRLSDMQGFINNGGIVICDRYSYSNVIHQGTLDTIDEVRTHLDYEMTKLGTIEPDAKILLRASGEFSMQGVDTRGNEKDIVEQKSIDGKIEEERMTQILIDNYGFKPVDVQDSEGNFRDRHDILSDLITLCVTSIE